MKRKSFLMVLIMVMSFLLVACAGSKAKIDFWQAQYPDQQVIKVSSYYGHGDAPATKVTTVPKDYVAPNFWQVAWAKITGKKLKTPRTVHDIYN